MKKLQILSLICSVFILFTGCNNDSSLSTETTSITIELKNGNKEDLCINPQKWHVTNKRICVLFGYDFNSPEIVEQYKNILNENFGLDENGGLIYPLVYPSDFKYGVKGYVNDFVNELQQEDKEFAGIVLLGAPERTHVALARNQDKWNQKMPYSVVALFPQDDVLGIEATCNLVFDKGQSAELAGTLVKEETESQIIEEAPEILINTINYLIGIDFSLPIDNSLQTHAIQMLQGASLHHYADPETGLQSINHFVLN